MHYTNRYSSRTRWSRLPLVTIITLYRTQDINNNINKSHLQVVQDGRLIPYLRQVQTPQDHRQDQLDL